MRITLAVLALAVAAGPAAAQDLAKDPAAAFDKMKPAEAGQLNQAVQSDAKARQALDTVEKALKDANHATGKLLEQTRQ
jgi:hypothetical protein